MPISAPKIPDGLPELMRGLAKSVIKENPENLYVHAAEYFENLIRERDGHLDHGYSTFNAYQVYADYKDKTREKLGLTKDPSLSDGNGGDGDESGSGGSESKLRGRKRRRARKPSSRERENPITMVGNPSVSDEGEPQQLKSFSEGSAPVPVVEREIVKVHYSPPEATPSPVRVVSAQSVEAEQAVSSILDDEQILDSDGTGGKETGDELVDNGDDIGTAPSTAEIAEQPRASTVDAEPNSQMALQDMETCLMHANVDELLEKRSKDYKPEEDHKMENVPEETKVSSATEGEDIPEGPQAKEDAKFVACDETSQAEEVVMDSDENKIQIVTVEEQQVDSGMTPTQVEGVAANDSADVVVCEESKDKDDNIEIQSEKQSDNLVNTAYEANEDNKEILANKSNTSKLTGKDDVQARSNDGEDSVDIVVNDINVEENQEFKPTESIENVTSIVPNPSSLIKDIKPESMSPTPASKENNEDESAATTEDTLQIATRMGFDDVESPDETDEGASKPIAPVVANVENFETDADLSDTYDKVTPEVNDTNQLIEPKEQDDKSVTVAENVLEIDNFVQDKPAEQDPGVDSKMPLIDDQEQSSDVDQSESNIKKNESTSIAEQLDCKEMLTDNSKQDSEEQQESLVDAKDETEKKAGEINATDSAEETKQENMVSVERNEALSTSEVVVTDSIEEKSNRLSDAVIDQESTSEQQAVVSNSPDDTKFEIEEKNESPNSQSNDQEVNEECSVTDANTMLTKDHSIEDVVHADATTSGTEIPPGVTDSELMVQDIALKQDDSIVESMNKTPKMTNEAMGFGEPEECSETGNEDGRNKQDEKQIKAPEEVKIEDQDSSIAKPEETETAADGLNADVNPMLDYVVVDEMQKLLSDENVLQQAEKTIAEDNVSENSKVEEKVQKAIESNLDASDDLIIATDASVEMRSNEDGGEVATDPEATGGVTETQRSSGDLESTADLKDTLDRSALPSLQSNDETPKRDVSLEEVIEEPCVKREITPSKTGPLEKDESIEKQVEELEEIKKVDISQLSKDSAEALFYSLKKSELENQDPADGGTVEADQTTTADTAKNIDDDDDQDVVVKEEPFSNPSQDQTKRTFTDDFLDEPTTTTTTTTMSGDGVATGTDPLLIEQELPSLEADEQQDEFNPMVMVSMRSKQFQEQLHSRGAEEQMSEAQANDATPMRPIMRRCMTEMSGLERYDAAIEYDTSDNRQEDLSYVEEEDQFDGYYIGHIKNKILASSVSVADSDCPDGTRSSVESVDENNVRTALETIASTDTESTIASQATIQQAGPRSYLRKHSQNTSSNIPYASFGNAAIDKSLDEFIEREEQHKQDEALAEAATKIQRSYRTHKKKLLRDYHSTMRTFTEDQSAESGEEYAANVIQIKLDQKRVDGADPSGGDAGEESDSTTPCHETLGTTLKRPMYSLNIDEYDTVARRMTLTRGVAMQRNSTPEDDSGKSSNVSTDRKPSLTSAAAVKKDSVPASESSGESPSSDEKPPEPDIIEGSSDEREPKDGALSSSRSKPKSGPAGTVTGREVLVESVPRTATTRTSYRPLDVQNLLLIARQRTMPVQIDSSVIRVLPKHMRKRISSAGMLNGNGNRK
uniref:RIIa domain-containing protein n=1 Tax=Anopheles christyi TaxID=43041 RepID=A0A182JQ74_9DIPT